jgi:hypothetical protein
MTWFVEEPQRFRAERQAIEELLAATNWLEAGTWRFDASLRVAYDAEIAVGDQRFPVTLQYPNHFPHSPPLVLPRDAEARWSAHQYGRSGELCLEIGPDNWHSSLTGADMLRSAHKLVELERPAAKGEKRDVPSRHATTLGQDLRGTENRLMITRELGRLLATLPVGPFHTGKLVFLPHEEVNVCLVGSLRLQDGSEWVDPSIPRQLRYESIEPKFALFRWAENAALPVAANAAELRAAVSANTENTRDCAYIFISRGESLTGYWLNEDKNTFSQYTAIAPGAALSRLDETHGLLTDKQVAVVGCGSLGSKVAVMLARAGVKSFLLVDDDVLLPDNLVRHELDWSEVGTHKVDAVARRIHFVSPDAKCSVRRHRLGGQEASGSVETLIEGLAAADLIFDATANSRAFGYISAAAASGKKPVVWAEVFGGGYGGLIARHRSGIEPDPADMRLAIEEWCREQDKPAQPAQGYESRIDDVTWIADDADVTVIAANAARLAIDTLMGRDPSAFPYSAYLIGLAKEWIFEQPFDTRPIPVGSPVTLEKSPLDDETKRTEGAFVAEMLQRFASAHSAARSDSETPAT